MIQVFEQVWCWCPQRAHLMSQRSSVCSLSLCVCPDTWAFRRNIAPNVSLLDIDKLLQKGSGAPHQWHHSINKFKDADFSCKYAGTVSQMAGDCCHGDQRQCAQHKCVSLRSHWWNPLTDTCMRCEFWCVSNFSLFIAFILQSEADQKSRLCDNEEGAGQMWGRKS